MAVNVVLTATINYHKLQRQSAYPKLVRVTRDFPLNRNTDGMTSSLSPQLRLAPSSISIVTMLVLVCSLERYLCDASSLSIVSTRRFPLYSLLYVCTIMTDVTDRQLSMKLVLPNFSLLLFGHEGRFSKGRIMDV